MGVFATRSPFRPNPLGLSCVELEKIEYTSEDGPVLIVRGADLMDGTPVYDIKPYVRYADSRPEAVCGYVDDLDESRKEVRISDELLELIGNRETAASMIEALSLDPRPSYHGDPHREYGMSFAGYNIRFTACGDVISVIGVEKELN